MFIVQAPPSNYCLQYSRIAELQQSHASELTHLRHAHSSELSSVQRALQEERSKREAAESSLETHRDVAISMEDVQPLVSLGGDNRPTSFGELGIKLDNLSQRFFTSPPILLMCAGMY